MGLFDMKYFELVKGKDELYRCRGGHVADIIFLSSAVICLFVLWIFSPIIYVFRALIGDKLNKKQREYLKKFKK